MARIAVHLTSLANEQNPTLCTLRSLSKDHFGERYVLAENPSEAEIVLFVENGYVGLDGLARVSKMQKANPRAQFAMFSECDWPFPFLPGLYASLVRCLPWASSWGYVLENGDAPADSPDHSYLYSFLGRISTHPVRRQIGRLDTPLTPCLDIADASQRFSDWDYRRTFAQVLRQSRFVLCPRGIGASSIRIFEAMRAGRVPVIVSDEWIEPPVGSWAEFSLRVKEYDVARIPEICAQFAGAADAMGRAARAVYERHFVPERFLETTLDAARANIAKSPARPFGPARRIVKALSLREFRSLGHEFRETLAGRSRMEIAR